MPGPAPRFRRALAVLTEGEGPLPDDPDKLRGAVARLRRFTSEFTYIIDDVLPPDFVFVPGVHESFAGGHPLKAVSDSLDNLSRAFGQVRDAMRELEPRDQRPPAGGTNGR